MALEAGARPIGDALETLFFAPRRRRALEAELAELRAARLVALECLGDLGALDALLNAAVDRDPVIRKRAAQVLAPRGRPGLDTVILGTPGDLRRLADSALPERLRLLLWARLLNAELPDNARALLQAQQGGAISLGGGEPAAGAISVSAGDVGGLSETLEPE